MSRRNWAALSALVAATALPGTAIAQDHSHDAIVHNGTGFRFPPMVDGFNRVSLQFFNDQATDISVAYASLTPGSPVTVTVYVTPSPAVDLTGSNAATEAAQARSCDQQFAAMDARFKKLHPDARQIVLGGVKAPSPAYIGNGRQVIYDYEDVFYGQKQTLRSETDIYCYVNGDWLVAYRTATPVRVDYAPKLAAFMQALRWPPIGAGMHISAPAPARAPVRLQTADNRVLVRLKSQKTQATLAGLVASGSDQDLKRFESAASMRGVEAHRVTENGKTESIASLLKPTIRVADAADLFRDARKGKFGRLALEVMLLPPGSTGEERDLLGRAAIVPAEALETL